MGKAVSIGNNTVDIQRYPFAVIGKGSTGSIAQVEHFEHKNEAQDRLKQMRDASKERRDGMRWSLKFYGSKFSDKWFGK